MRTACVTVLSGVLIVGLAGVAVPDTVTLLGVPSYIWYNGCGPTAGGMVIGYWDSRGYSNLVPGSSDWYSNQQAVKDMIASPGHVRDYVPTPDRVATLMDPYHADDSVADFSRTSRDPNAYGWGLFGMQDDGLKGFSAFRGYALATAKNKSYLDDTFWSWYVTEIFAGRPVELLTDSNADGVTDHFVTAIGFDNTPGARKYAAYNTYDHNVHWYDFAQPLSGRSYGVYGGTSFDPGPLPGDANRDGAIDGRDLAVWQQHYDPLGLNADNNSWATGDWNLDGRVNGADMSLWQQHYNPLGVSVSISINASPVYLNESTNDLLEVPEPASLALVLAGILSLTGARIGKRKAQSLGRRALL